jgi:hypothetical protein
LCIISTRRKIAEKKVSDSRFFQRFLSADITKAQFGCSLRRAIEMSQSKLSPESTSSAIFLELGRRFTHSSCERNFRAHFGGPSLAVQKLFQWILFHLEGKDQHFDPDDLLMCLYFLKTGGPNWEVISSRFGIHVKTFKAHLNATLDLIISVLPKVVFFWFLFFVFSFFFFSLILKKEN